MCVLVRRHGHFFRRWCRQNNPLNIHRRAVCVCVCGCGVLLASWRAAQREEFMNIYELLPTHAWAFAYIHVLNARIMMRNRVSTAELRVIDGSGVSGRFPSDTHLHCDDVWHLGGGARRAGPRTHARTYTRTAKYVCAECARVFM